MSWKSSSLLIGLLALMVAGLFQACEDISSNGPIQPTGTSIQLVPRNLPTLLPGNELVYELWVANVDTIDRVEVVSNFTTLGKFCWNAFDFRFLSTSGSARADSNVFYLPAGEVFNDFDRVMLSIEPVPDPSPEPSKNYAISADINPNYPTVQMQFGWGMAAGTGTYMLTTLSDLKLATQGADELSGVWFANQETPEGQEFSLLSLRASLDLPLLDEDVNFIYEGWVSKITGNDTAYLSLGRFRNPNFRDLDNRYLDELYIPNLPGEDFLRNAPPGFTFPLDLRGTGDVFITLEPYPDPAPAEPFHLIVLSRNLPLANEEHAVHDPRTLGNRQVDMPKIEITRLSLTH